MLGVLLGLEVEKGLEAGDVVLDDGELLVLDGTADLDDAGSTVDELEGDVGAVDTTSGEDGEARDGVSDGADHLEGDRTVGVSRHSSVCGLFLSSNVGPCDSLRADSHQTRDRVDRGHSIGTFFFIDSFTLSITKLDEEKEEKEKQTSFSGSTGDRADISDVGCEFGKEGDSSDLLDPLADLSHHLGLFFFSFLSAHKEESERGGKMKRTNILTTGKTHSTFTHSVRARKVELKGMRTSLEGDLGKTLF